MAIFKVSAFNIQKTLWKLKKLSKSSAFYQYKILVDKAVSVYKNPANRPFILSFTAFSLRNSKLTVISPLQW